MSTCRDCAGRGWGVRNGIVRRCERCAEVDSDQEAFDLAEAALGAYLLPPRPASLIDATNGIVCPWCEYRPKHREELFDLVVQTERRNCARLGVDPRNGSERLELGNDDHVDGSLVDPCMWCPRCRRTFQIPDDMDWEILDQDPSLASWPIPTAAVLDRVTLRVRDAQPFLASAGVVVSKILQRLAAGASLDELERTHPGLEAADVRAALEYAAWHIESASGDANIQQFSQASASLDHDLD